jgi:hypothetical protein
VNTEKGVFVHAMKAYRDSRGISPLILNFGTGWMFLKKRKILCLSGFKPWMVQPVA